MSATTSLMARVRVMLARHPSLYWTVVAACAGIVAWATSAALAAPVHERAAWGTSRRAWVADRDLAPGSPIAAHPVEVPVALVPTGALTAFDQGTAAGPIASGEILVDHDIAGTGRWALVPPGWRAIAVPHTDATLDVEPGDRVDVHWAGGPLTADAMIVAVDESAITVAITAADAGAVAVAASDPSLVLALVGV